MTEAIKMIKISSSDDQVFEVEEKVITQSTLIKNMLNDLEVSDTVIPLQNITSDILKKVIEYAEHHKDDEPHVEETEKKVDSAINNDWDKKFMDLDRSIIFDIILAANYLDMEELLNLGCKTIANNYIKGKSADEIREIFGIEKGCFR
jgi:S-phase kinase-associated protein 1